jgi:hypothetical protein
MLAGDQPTGKNYCTTPAFELRHVSCHVILLQEGSDASHRSQGAHVDEDIDGAFASFINTFLFEPGDGGLEGRAAQVSADCPPFN